MPHTYANVANAIASNLSLDDEKNIKDGELLDFFLKKVQKGVKNEVQTFLSRYMRTDQKKERSPDTDNCLSKQLIDALDEGNVFKIWRLIVEMKEKEEHKAIGTSSAMFNDIVEEENMKDNIMGSALSAYIDLWRGCIHF